MFRFFHSVMLAVFLLVPEPAMFALLAVVAVSLVVPVLRSAPRVFANALFFDAPPQVQTLADS
jgi:hypothetical protein